MQICLLSLLVLQCSLLAMSVSLKVAVIVEDGVVSPSLIENAFSHRVSSNWRVLVGHSFTFVEINATACSVTQITRSLCGQTGLSGVIAVGHCSTLEQIGSLTKTMQLPLITVPTGICDDSLMPADYSVTAMHSPWHMVNSAVEAMAVKTATQVALFYDSMQSSMVIQNLQTSLSKRGISSLSFQVDSNNGVLLTNLGNHLTRLLKKKVFHMLVLAEPANVLAILDRANTSLVMQQNYFWLLIDTGIAKAQLRPHVIANSNVALLRGGTTGLNTPGSCSAPVRDVFDTCDTDWIRTMDARFVDAVEALAKALNDSVTEVSFNPSNSSCNPLQVWNSGPAVYSKLSNMASYDSNRGIISFNSSTRHFDSQGIEVIGTFNLRVSSPMQFLQSGLYSTQSSSMSVVFHERGVSLIFPNTFLGFKNETLLICSPVIPPFTTFTASYPNKTVIVGSMLKDILDILSEKLDFRYQTKAPDDGQWGAPQAGKDYFTGCVGEIQRGLVHFGGGPYTKTSVRDVVIDFGWDLFQEANAILVPMPPPESKLWNVYTPFNYDVWILVIVTLFVTAVVTWILAYFSPFTAYNLGLEFAIADEIWLQEYLWSIIGSFMQQGQDFYPFAMSPRAVLAFWWMFTVIIYGTYTGDLTAHLTITVTDLPIKTLDDLVSQTAIKPLVPIGTNIETLLKMSTSGVYKQMADMMIPEPSISRCAERVFTENVACVIDYTYLLYIAKANCSQVYLANELFNTATVAFMYADDAYYGGMFDLYFQKLHETGIMQKLFNTYWSSDAVCSAGTSTEAAAITLEGTGGCFIAALACYILGLVILGVELLWTKAMKKQPLDCVVY